MFKTFAKTGGVLIMLVAFIGCGSDPTVPCTGTPEAVRQISSVLDRWREGYETEDVNTYIGTFWEDGFLYVSDMGTDADKTDDVEFDDIRQERATLQRPTLSNKSLRYFTGIAKFRFCPTFSVATAIPITSPCLFSTGPPLLPSEIGALI